MAKKKSRFLGKVNTDAQRQKTAGSSYGYLIIPKGITVFSPEPGSKVKMDILPYEVTNPKHPDRNDELEIAVPGELWYKRPFKIHRNVGVEKDTVICLSSFGKKCPICEYRAKRMKEGAEKEELDSMKASLRNLYCVVPIGHKKYEEKPHVWDVSQYLFQNLLNDELEENEDYGAFPDLEVGYTLRIRFDSSSIGGGNAFAEASRIDFDDRDEVYEDDILDEVPDLDAMLTELSYKEMDLKFLEMEEEADEEEADEDDEKPKRRKKKVEEEEKPTRRKKKKEEEEEEEPEEEEEEESVKTTRRKKKPVKEEEPEEEEEEPEEEEEEEEEEEAPVKTTRKRRVKKEEKEPEELQDQDDAEFVDKSVKRKIAGKSAKGKTKDKCPHGHKFGVDVNEYDECEVCEMWDECMEENEG